MSTRAPHGGCTRCGTDGDEQTKANKPRHMLTRIAATREAIAHLRRSRRPCLSLKLWRCFMRGSFWNSMPPHHSSSHHSGVHMSCAAMQPNSLDNEISYNYCPALLERAISNASVVFGFNVLPNSSCSPPNQIAILHGHFQPLPSR